MKRISPRTVTVGVIATVSGLLVAYAAHEYVDMPTHNLGDRPSDSLRAPPICPPRNRDRPLSAGGRTSLATPRKQTATVITPKVNLPKYSRIRDEDLEVTEVPIGGLPEGAVRTKSGASARLVKTTIAAGQPILESDLYTMGEGPSLADQPPPGTPARNTPTLAPPQSPPVVAAGSRLARGARGQVIYVHVEAEEAGAAGD